MAMTRTESIAGLRAAFPAFSDELIYQSEQVGFWFDMAARLMSAERWGSMYDFGARLFVAHNLSLDGSNAAVGGQQPGAVLGAVTSATVDKVGYSRDPGKAMDPKDGHWNLSTFGLRYIALVRMVGMGPVQVGAPFGPATAGFGPGERAGWPGVIFPPASI